jgi:hypothetical protein
MNRLTNFFAHLTPQTYLGAVLGSIALSLALREADKKAAASFVGLWAPTILNLGLYMKLLTPAEKEATPDFGM